CQRKVIRPGGHDPGTQHSAHWIRVSPDLETLVGRNIVSRLSVPDPGANQNPLRIVLRQWRGGRKSGAGQGRHDARTSDMLRRIGIRWPAVGDRCRYQTGKTKTRGDDELVHMPVSLRNIPWGGGTDLAEGNLQP